MFSSHPAHPLVFSHAQFAFEFDLIFEEILYFFSQEFCITSVLENTERKSQKNKCPPTPPPPHIALARLLGHTPEDSLLSTQRGP